MRTLPNGCIRVMNLTRALSLMSSFCFLLLEVFALLGFVSWNQAFFLFLCIPYLRENILELWMRLVSYGFVPSFSSPGCYEGSQSAPAGLRLNER